MVSIIYLDNAATTKPKQEVIKEIEYVLEYEWGNPSSLYGIGRNAKQIVDKSRKIVADFIGAKPSEIIFTSGACESNSMAIGGYINQNCTKLVTTTIEHKSIVNIADTCSTDYVNVDGNGHVDMEQLENICKSNVNGTLYSIQFANNEIGTIQDIKEISEIVHRYGGILHTDATQMIPNSPVNVNDLGVNDLGIDMMSFSGQKLGATKGIGVLYVRNGIELEPIIYGSQESSRRGGTENVPYIAGLAKAIEIIYYQTSEIRDYFLEKLQSELDDIYVIGDMKQRLNNNLSICFKGIEAESLLLLLDNKEIYVSSGSACNSKSIESSYVLSAINMDKDESRSVIRFSFGEDTTKKQCDNAITEIKKIVERLRRLNEVN